MAGVCRLFLMISLQDYSPSGNLADEMHALFSQTGALSESKDFEYRPEQQQMARHVAEALGSAQPLVVEAGTGVGKSLAYLLPALSLGLAEKRKVVVSTHTINLQEQLIRKDIRIVRKILGGEFKAVLYKGRGNFVCPLRLTAAFQQSGDLFNSGDLAELQEIHDWARTTEDGSLADLDFSPSPRVWAQVCSEPHICTVKKCGPTRCFYQKMRRDVMDADIVVVNHTLLFTLLGGADLQADDEDDDEADSTGLEKTEAGLLFPRDLAVIDEAHTLENVAAKQLGMNLSHSQLRFLAHRLYNPRSRKGLFQAAKDVDGVRATAELLDEIDDFFTAVEESASFRGPAREFRVREPELVADSLSKPLLGVQQMTQALAQRVEKEPAKLELGDIAGRLRDARLGISSFLDLSADEHVYWVERSGGHDGRPVNVSMHAAPLDISERLRNIFFRSGRRCVLTSATLGVGDRNLGYFRQRVGAEDATAIQIGSPFDYKKQMKLYLVKSMADPKSPKYEEQLERWIRHFLAESGGRAFVLFTSYRLMDAIAGRVEDFVAENGWELLIQGKSGSRSAIMERFKNAGSAVLLGTDSFWTGVDVPGEALSNVMITRLPFAVPDHPLTEARLEQIEERGGNSFMEYSVPEAILKLRQGVGRLIRSKKDSGMVVLLDNRVLTKRYGQAFLRALPESAQEVVE